MLRAASAASVLVMLASCVGNDPAIDASSSGGAPDGGAQPDGSSSGDPGCVNTVCGSTCVDLQTSKDHCGACDHSCGGADCNAGVCAPIALATQVNGPTSIIVSENTVFWSREGAIQSCPVTGCSTPKMLTGEGDTFTGLSTETNSGRRIAVAANQVFWIGTRTSAQTATTIFRCPTGSGCPGGSYNEFFVADTNDEPAQIVADGNTILFTREDSGVIPCDATQPTCAASPLAGTPGDQVYAVAIAPGRFFWTVANGKNGDFGGAFGCALTGCSPLPDPTLPLFDPSFSLVWHADTLYVNQYGKIASCSATTGCAGNPKELAAGQDETSPLAADGHGVFWVQRGNQDASAGPPNGRVLMCRLPDCAGGPRELATAQAAPRSIFVFDGFVYWANRGTGSPNTGSIMRVRY